MSCSRARQGLWNCFGYCNFCFEALGTLEKNPSPEKLFLWSDWQKSLEYITRHPEIEEVILSGGEPLLNSDSKLERILSDISNIKNTQGGKVRFKRIHTRVLTFNPYRITDDLAKLLGDSRVNEIAFNVAHPSEITPEFEESVGRIREGAGKYAPLLVIHTPLLKGVNDNTDVLWELFARAYENNIKPYYLLHTMPHTPYANQQRISVRDGIKLLKPLWRKKSHVALPEYVIVHYGGKHTVPLELEGTPEFQYTKDANNNPIIRFLNWQDKRVEYPDAAHSR
ncbi:radical SAM protein [Candidatus Woesearchaeota archaeon]|nr:radical SAM protein [Candidatus Woesearchaeota archaeon]